jgi:hypothetical protein
MGLARQDQGARRKSMSGCIVDDQQRRDYPQSPCAQRVAAVRRLADNPARSAAGATVLETQPLVILGRTPSPPLLPGLAANRHR